MQSRSINWLSSPVNDKSTDTAFSGCVCARKARNYNLEKLGHRLDYHSLRHRFLALKTIFAENAFSSFWEKKIRRWKSVPSLRFCSPLGRLEGPEMFAARRLIKHICMIFKFNFLTPLSKLTSEHCILSSNCRTQKMTWQPGLITEMDIGPAIRSYFAQLNH